MFIGEITTPLIERGRGQNWLRETFPCTIRRDQSQLTFWEAPKLYQNGLDNPARFWYWLSWDVCDYEFLSIEGIVETRDG